MVGRLPHFALVVASSEAVYERINAPEELSADHVPALRREETEGLLHAIEQIGLAPAQIQAKDPRQR